MKGDFFEDFFLGIPIFTEICSYESKLKKNMVHACGMSFLEAYMERNDMSRLYRSKKTSTKSNWESRFYHDFSR